MNPDLERLRTLCAEGDADAAASLHERARRAGLDADRRVAARVLLATGRWRLEVARAQLEDQGHERALVLDGQPTVLAVAHSLLAWSRDRDLAWTATETLREAFGEAWQPEAVPAELREAWRAAIAAHPVPSCTATPATSSALRTALDVITQRHAFLDRHCTELESHLDDRFGRAIGDRPTELTTCVFDGDELATAHIGCGGALLWRDGQARALTRPHSLAVELRDQGLITREELATHPNRNTRLRALGGRPGAPGMARVDFGAEVLLPGDTLVLSTSWQQFDEALPTALFGAHAAEPSMLAGALLERARKQDAKLREVTVLVARLESDSHP